MSLWNRYANALIALVHAELLLISGESGWMRLIRLLFVVTFGWLTLHAWGVSWKLEKKSAVTSSSPKVLTVTSEVMGLPLSSAPPSGPVLGWRMFRCQRSAEGYKLHSVVVRMTWEGPSATDICGPNDGAWHAASMQSHYFIYNPWSHADRHNRHDGVGFFALRTVDKQKLTDYEHGSYDPRLVWENGEDVLAVVACPVLAQVECFGEIVEHENGWRSQGQIIRRLIVGDAEVAADLERRYQCDVEVRDKVLA
jgi:hypothetical protein